MSLIENIWKWPFRAAPSSHKQHLPGVNEDPESFSQKQNGECLSYCSRFIGTWLLFDFYNSVNEEVRKVSVSSSGSRQGKPAVQNTRTEQSLFLCLGVVCTDDGGVTESGSGST